MTSTTVTHAQLVEVVKAYRSLGSKIRAEVKAGKPDLFIDRNRRFQKVLVGKLAEAGHMDLVLALADEQVGLDGIAFAKALYPSHEAKSREVLRNARRRIKAMLSDTEANEALATLPVEAIAELTGAEMVAEQPKVRTGGWYLVPAQGERLTDRHDVLGPYTTQDMAEHMRKTYADEGIDGVVVQSATRPVLAPREADVSTMTLAELVHLRRDCAAIFRSPVPLEDDSYVLAARRTEEVDQELLVRQQTGLRASLVTEASNVVAVEHAERNGYEVQKYVVEQLSDVRIGIKRHLRLFGHLVRD